MFVANNNLLKNENIVYGRPIRMDINLLKKNKSIQYKIKTMYNSDSNLKKIVLISPMIDLNINWTNLKFQIIKYSLEPLAGPNFKLYDIINELEASAFIELKRVFGLDINFKSVITNISSLDDGFIDDEENNTNLNYDTKTLTLKISKNVTTYDSNGCKMEINKLENKNRNYKFVIELTELWYDSEKRLGGCNFNIVQIKHFPFYYERDLIDVIESNNISIISNKGNIPPPPPPPLPLAASSYTVPTTFNFNNISIVKEKDILNKPSFSIDKNTLSNALNKLKKVS